MATDTHYERLSFLDSTFLSMEDRNAHFHVASVMVFKAGGLQDDGEGPDVERLKALIASKLHLIPRYRQVLNWVPIEEHPVWVDDEYFDIDYHVRHTSLYESRDEAELMELAGQIFSQKLDRFRPLWEVWLVDGFKDGRFAVIAKVHHCMIDGMSGVDLLWQLLAPMPVAEVEPPTEVEPRPAPSRAELLTDEIRRRVTSPLRFVRRLPDLAEEAETFRDAVDRRLRAMGKALASGWLHNASRTPLNQRIGPNREFQWFTVDLQDAKKVKNGWGGSINDVVLATVAGAVRKYLRHHGEEVDELDFRVMSPVSVRSKGDQSLGNQVAMWLLDLPIGERTQRGRFKKVVEGTSELKETNQALGASLLVQASSWTPSTVLTQAMRLAGTSVRPFNMTVTNIPGPQIPIYMLDAELEAIYPMVPLWTNHGVGIALMSYNGRIAWGVVADADSVPDLDLFVKLLRESFRNLVKAAAK